MRSGEKYEQVAKSSQRVSRKLAVIYLLLVVLFISLILFL